MMNFMTSFQRPILLPLALLPLALTLLLTGCANDITARSASNANSDMAIPAIKLAGDDSVEANLFQLASTTQKSTLNWHIDNNSYGNLRRAITNQSKPTAIKLADWVNYFNYSYAKPEGHTPFRITTEVAPTPWNTSSNLMLVAVAASNPQAQKASTNNIVVLVDTNQRLAQSRITSLIKKSLNDLASQVTTHDRIALVTYSSNPTVLLESTTGDLQTDIIKGFDAIRFGEETNEPDVSSSINLAYNVLAKNQSSQSNNIILFITDGELGSNKTSMAALEKTLTTKQAAGLTFSPFVFNTQNYAYQTMQTLADAGGGRHAYIDTINEAHKAISQQLSSGNHVIAKPVDLSVTFNPDYIQFYRLLGYEKSQAATINSKNSNAVEGDMLIALYEIQTTGKTPAQEKAHQFDSIAKISMRYQQPNQSTTKLVETSVVPGQMKTELNKASKDFRFASSVASLALYLKQDNQMQEMTLEQIIALANSGVEKDTFNVKAEFVRLLQTAQDKGLN